MALSTTYWVKLIDKKKFAKAALDKNIEAFVVQVASFTSKITIYLVFDVQILLLLVEKVTISVEYFDYADVFSKKSSEMLLDQTSSDK